MLARAKINLTLHVGRVIRDADRFHGYHPLDSLVVFADVGDELGFEAAAEPELVLGGPFGKDLPADGTNLVTRALHAANRVQPGSGNLRVTLSKHLPLSSGVGGGSADAAAVLRHALEGQSGLADIALSLGADVPACVTNRTLRMTGVGEDITPLPGLGTLPAVLANPGVSVSTAEVFRHFDAGEPRETPRPQVHGGTLLERALAGRNDLAPIAKALAPSIAELEERMTAQPGCTLARMSGSGATVFGLFGTDAEAEDAARTLRDAGVPWAVACTLGDAEE